jgi:hypothetical protein
MEENYIYKFKREFSPEFKYKVESVKYFLKYISYNLCFVCVSVNKNMKHYKEKYFTVYLKWFHT